MSGGGNLPLMVVPKAGFDVEGLTVSFDTTGDSGRKLSRHFCPTCGSTLFATAEALPNDYLIAVGTLDDPGQFTPRCSIHAGSRVHWDHLVQTAPGGLKPPGAI